MGVVASGPPFRSNSLLCECGWMYAPECKGDSKCGLNQGMPEYDREGVIESELIEPIRHEWKHTPYEFLSESAKEAAVNVVRDMIENSKSTHQVGGTHYAEMSVQPWTAIKAWMSPGEYAGYHVGTVIGYLSRHKKKGRLTDIKKAKHHLEELIRYFEEDEEYPW